MARFFRPLSSRGVTFWPLWKSCFFFSSWQELLFCRDEFLQDFSERRTRRRSAKLHGLALSGETIFCFYSVFKGSILLPMLGSGAKRILCSSFSPILHFISTRARAAK